MSCVSTLESERLLHFPTILSGPHVLSKIVLKQVHSVTLIALCWQIQLWCPLVDRPVFMKNAPRVSVNPSARTHLSTEQHSYICGLEGTDSENFPRKQPNLLPGQEEIINLEEVFWLVL